MIGALKRPVRVSPRLKIDATLRFVTSSLKSVYGTVTGALGPGTRSRTSKKLASKTRTNQSQVLRGGIFDFPAAFAASRLSDD